MDDLRALKALQLDALREVANIGAGHAATALSQMIERHDHDQRADDQRRRGSRTSRRRSRQPGRAGRRGAHAHAGRPHGAHAARASPKPTAARLASSCCAGRPGTTDDFGEMEQSAIKEAGNILSSAYMNALSDFMGMMLLPSPPSLAIDMSRAVLTTAYLQFGTDRDYVFCVESEFYIDDAAERLRGFFLLLPDPASLQAILRAVRVA